MSKLFSIVLKICIAFIPFLLVYGLIRVTLLHYPIGSFTLVDSDPNFAGYDNIVFDYGGFLPSIGELLDRFARIPDISDYMKPAMEAWDKAISEWENKEVTDFFSFWEQAGNFFILVGNFFWVGGMAISYPFAVFGWLFSFLFTPCSGEYCTNFEPVVLDGNLNPLHYVRLII